MTQVLRIGSIGGAVVAAMVFATGCDETTVQQAIRGLGISVNIGADRPRGGVDDSRGNSNSNSNDDQSNANSNTNSSDDRGDDDPHGGTGNANTNTNSNTNDNTPNTGTCTDGSTRLEGSIDAPVELEAEYRRHPAGCARFRVKVEGYAAGTYEMVVNGTSVGTIVVGGNARGEREFDTSDGNFPASFPQMQLGDVVLVGAYSVTLGNDCSSTPEVCNANGNTNTNTNTNTNDNTDDDSNGNNNTNSNDNG